MIIIFRNMAVSDLTNNPTKNTNTLLNINSRSEVRRTWYDSMQPGPMASSSSTSWSFSKKLQSGGALEGVGGGGGGPIGVTATVRCLGL